MALDKKVRRTHPTLIQATFTKASTPPVNRPLVLLWLLPVRQDTYSSRFKMVKLPLQQTMFLLWLIGLWRIFQQPFNLLQTGQSLLELNHSYAISVFWGALVTGLLAGYARRLATLLPLSIILLMAALLIISPVSASWLFLIAAAFAMIFWLLTLVILKLPPQSWVAFLGWQGGYGVKGGRVLAEQTVHWTVFTISLLSMGAAFVGETLAPLFTFGIVGLFFWMAGLRYHLQLHSYLLIASVGLGGLTLMSAYSVLYLLETPQIITPLLTLMAIGLAILAQHFVPYRRWQNLYKRPIYHTAVIVYFWALLNSLFLFINLTDSPTWLPYLFIVLALGQLPLLRPLKNAPALRGVGIGLLLSIAFAGLLLEQRLEEGFIPYALMVWGFFLWSLANFGLPRLNARWARWAISPNFWPTLGLLFVLGGFWLDITMVEFWRWQTLLIVTLYLLLLFRNVDWKLLPWLAALALTGSGLAALIPLFSFVSDQQSLVFIFSVILWADLLLFWSWLSKRYDNKFLTQWKFHRLAEPLVVWSFLLLGSSLLLLFWANFYKPTSLESVWGILGAILLNLSFLQVLRRHPHWLTAHTFLLSLLNTVLLLWFNLPLLLSLWTLGLVLFIYNRCVAQ